MTRLLGGEAILASGIFLVALGVLVFAARPGRAINRVCGALFAAQGAATAAYQLLREASSAAEALAWFHVATWLEAPALVLTALLLHLLFPPQGPARWRRWALAGVGAFAAACLAALAYDARTLTMGVVSTASGGGRGAYTTAPTPLAHALLAATWLVQSAAVALAARAAASPLRSAMQRRQAGLVGLSFAFLIGHAAALRLAALPAFLARTNGLVDLPPAEGWPAPVVLGAFLAVQLAAVVGVAAVLGSVSRLSRPFEERARVAAVCAALLALAFGVFDGALRPLVKQWVPLASWYFSSRFLWVGASAACLALALVRYDLGGLGDRMRRRVTALSHASLVLLAALLPVAVVLAAGGASSGALVLALLLGLAALTLSQSPLRAVAHAFSAALLASPSSPAAVGDRARAYAAALEARIGTDGQVPGAEDPALRALRDELGIPERDHVLIAEVVRKHRAQARPEPLLLGRYRVERELGRGAFGVALLAMHASTGERVVLKRLHAGEAERRILAEARALRAVRHPRIVPLLDVERAGRETFLVLAYVEGGSAQDRLAREGPFPPERAVRLALDVLEGLEALHAAGIVHADVKPGNVLLDAQGRGLLGDLGSAHGVPRAEDDLTLTSGAGAGTYATLAPERLRGARPSAAADVYAVGATLFRLLTGEDYVALAGKSPFEAGEAILQDAPRLPHPRVPAPLAPVLARALEKRPEARFESAGAMRRALEAAAGAMEPPPVQGG